MEDVEEVRRRYRPERVATLFLGESAPASGDFFYLGRNAMTTHMRRVLMPEATTDKVFLAGFKTRGWYLDDLVLIPIDKMAHGERRAHWVRSLPSFTARLAEYRPAAVVTLLAGMHAIVLRAVREAGHEMPVHSVPFPGHGNQGRFRAELGALLPILPRV
ncbi:MAG: hypothetical protein JOY90_35615 [Bradyrhizobium sp.]|uniref:hypothetical protein n=1 Tax=Bradyrhizobium sp. TaxID=376 RepID=UPI001E053798|nr:hypothetical protein [Bradyrhizobium sp.]MBV9565744.1 hypothetical protein [Bradyrhizobium sp.]